MKDLFNFFRNKSLQAALMILAAMLLLNACKKVDDRYTVLANIPWVYTINFPKEVLVGDTLTLQGKMFIGQGGIIQVGGVTADLVSKMSSTGSDGSVYDEVRFVITKQMGLGKTAVKLVAKGTTVDLPVIDIRQFAGIAQQTDTSLYVAQIAQYQPADLADYQANTLSLLINSSTDANGTVWFDNPLGIFKLNGAYVENSIHAGALLNDANGPFLINRIIGSVISYDGNTLSFSAAVSDNADTVSNYVFKLCQYDVASKSITTLNRTLVSKVSPGTDSLPGAFEGSVASLHIVAMSLRTDANNVLYFNNVYLVASPNNDPGFWYNTNVRAGNNPQGQYVVNDICKLTTAGQVSSLFSLNAQNTSNNPLFRVPGFPLTATSDYKISPDGSTAYVYDQTVAYIYLSLLQYDIVNNIPLHSSGAFASYRIVSFDTAAASSFQGNISPYLSFSVSPNGDYALQPLPNGTILMGAGASIAAVNNLTQTGYAFAGSEVGLNGSPSPSQTQTTGKAKDVTFIGGNAANLVFCGVDKNGSVYYVSSATGNDLFSPPLTFYKIYAKK